MKTPKQSKIHQDGTHRLIPYRYSDRGKPILNRLAEDDELLSDLTELEGATNDRLLGESGKLPGISACEELKEIGWMDEEVSPYIDYLADARI
jgi:hypothetical protein